MANSEIKLFFTSNRRLDKTRMLLKCFIELRFVIFSSATAGASLLLKELLRFVERGTTFYFSYNSKILIIFVYNGK